jgi:hypothetical protein
MPNMQGAMGSPNKFTPRTLGRRTQNPRPDSYPHSKDNRIATGNIAGKPKAPVANPFIPASVQAKQFSAPVKAAVAKAAESGVPNSGTGADIPVTKAPDSSSLELDLKRLLNVKE